MTRVQAVISDFGGVLTSPLAASFASFEQDADVPLAQLGSALAAVGERHGANPLFELETGRLTEAEFLSAIGEQLTEQMGRSVDLGDFGERYFAKLSTNLPLIEYLGQLRERGYRLAICTNNVREWESRWRSLVPDLALFDVIVDSAFVGTRKPEREIYEITLQRLGVEPQAALFIDDVELNCDAARDLGLRAIWFRSNEQTIAETEAALREGGT